MLEMTLAEKVARTRAMYAELASMWGDKLPIIGLHHLSHDEIHDCGYPAHVCRDGAGQFISAALGMYPFAPELYGAIDPNCERCRDAAVGIARLVNAEEAVRG